MDYLILAFIGFIAALTPGPDIFYIIRQGLCNGLRNALLAVAGILTGNVVYLTLVALGVGAIGKNPYFQAVVGILGGIYLIRIAFLVFKEEVKLNKTCNISSHVYKEALFLNLSNPKAMIFFAVVITPFLGKSIFLSVIFLFFGIALAFLLAAVVSSKIELEEKILNFVNKIAAVVFFGFGIKLLFVAVNAIKEIL
jgi:threonine/homoserine/homoserine lactone efflux protein